MTDHEIATEYLRREADANRSPKGADCAGIIDQMSEEYGLCRERIRQAVINETIMDAS